MALGLLRHYCRDIDEHDNAFYFNLVTHLSRLKRCVLKFVLVLQGVLICEVWLFLIDFKLVINALKFLKSIAEKDDLPPTLT